MKSDDFIPLGGSLEIRNLILPSYKKHINRKLELIEDNVGVVMLDQLLTFTTNNYFPLISSPAPDLIKSQLVAEINQNLDLLKQYGLDRFFKDLVANQIPNPGSFIKTQFIQFYKLVKFIVSQTEEAFFAY